MNILVLDPQGQFYNDMELLPQGVKLEDKIKEVGMKYEKYRLLEDIYLPANAYELFASLLQKSGFIRRSFNILSDREQNAADAIAIYLENLKRNSHGRAGGIYGNLNKLSDDAGSLRLMQNTLRIFTQTEDIENSRTHRTERHYNDYIDIVYSQPARKDQLIDQLSSVLGDEARMEEIYERYWKPIAFLFCEKKADGTDRVKISDVIERVTTEGEKGNCVVLDLSERTGHAINENIQAMFVKIIENEVKIKGEAFYNETKKVNCLIVMDEAHRFISRDSEDPQVAQLTEEIIDSVRTTRKFGIGYMFITQTIESLDHEIVEQVRISAFGYGLTSGGELRRISDIINSEAAIKLYRSFIDPSSNNKFPFMFFGPISPLSFTGSSLFLEVYSDFAEFK